jgi:phosphoenolpyruvate-protein phosphotransferase (PTS system enzyme I)
MFLHMPAEENPFLGWRAIRVCLDEPELFRTQLRALLRATAHGDVRIMLPLVNDASRSSARGRCWRRRRSSPPRGSPSTPGYKLGIDDRDPGGAALDAVELARHSTSSRSARTTSSSTRSRWTAPTRASPSSTTRSTRRWCVQLHQVARAGNAAGIEVSVCGEMAANPLGAFLLIGLDITVALDGVAVALRRSRR